MNKTLIFGAGWIGKQFHKEIKDSFLSTLNIADKNAIVKEIEQIKPDCILNCAGKTGRPNIDSLEKIPAATYEANVIGPIILASIAKKKGLYFIHMGSGCIYQGDNKGKGFSEEDPANFKGSLYVRSKITAELALKDFEALQLRIRMPISAKPHARNLITKLVQYEKIIQEPNSVTVLEDFFPVALELMKKKSTGIYNVINEGIEYHQDVLDYYREFVDPDFQFKVISSENLNQNLVSGRSNCILNTDKLKNEGLSLPEVKVSLRKILPLYAGHLKKI
jgi:dTDP-4-dehydrorhamnose reductase